MNLLVWLIAGGVIGWIASILMNTHSRQGVLLNVVVGIAGSMLGGFLLGPVLSQGTINQRDFSLFGLLVSLLGTIILLAIVSLVRQDYAR